MAGTTPVTIFEDTFTEIGDWLYQLTLTDELTLHQFSDYRAGYMNHWSTLMPHYKASNVTKMDIKGTITTPMTRSCKNIYKDPYDINMR